VSLEVPEGGITCVVGPNGAGKSTLMATISGLLRPRLGSMMLDGQNLVGRSPRQVFEVFPQIAGWAGQKAGSLSGGQQRLVEFARALMLEPRLLLLDEPSMGLAPKILRTVFDAIRQMNAAGTTMLLVEQNARAGLRLSDHGVVMENGRVRLSGTGREVLGNPEIGALYLGGAVGSS
jgi:branched-chain amino acid transport system ATP-binding protein